MTPDSNADTSKIIRKFSKRGYRFVEYLSCNDAQGNCSGLSVYGGRFRTIRDASVRKVSFEPYLETENQEIPFHCYYNAMGYISWYETQHKTTAVRSLLESIDFPFVREPMTFRDQAWSGANQLFDPWANRFARAYAATEVARSRPTGARGFYEILRLWEFASRLPF